MRPAAAVFALLLAGGVAKANVINFRQLNEHVYRGGRLANGEADYAALQALGVRWVINLDPMTVDDEELCIKYGMTCESGYTIALIPGQERQFDYQTLIRAYERVREHARDGEKVYIHCYHGSDRTGALAAALTLHDHQELPPSELKALLHTGLMQSKFHLSYFPKLYATIMSWADARPAWLNSTTRVKPLETNQSTPPLYISIRNIIR